MVVVPHPDDETFGAGATIARKRAAGTRVDVVIVTDGRRSHQSQIISPDELAARRADEARAACAALGVPEECVHLLGVPEDALGAHLDDVTDRLHALVAARTPEEVLTTSARDWHEDHRAVAHLVRRLGVPVREFPIWWWADGPWIPRGPGQSIPTRLAHLALEPIGAAMVGPLEGVATGGFLDAKRAAMAAYASQTTNLTGEADWLFLDAAWREQFCGARELFLPVALAPHVRVE